MSTKRQSGCDSFRTTPGQTAVSPRCPSGCRFNRPGRFSWFPGIETTGTRQHSTQGDCTMKTASQAIAIVTLLALGADRVFAEGGALTGDRHRVIISTDIGGTDPDDFQ